MNEGVNEGRVGMSGRAVDEAANRWRCRFLMLAAVRCSGARRRMIAVALRRVCCPLHQHIVPSFHRGLAYYILIVLMSGHDDTNLLSLIHI